MDNFDVSRVSISKHEEQSADKKAHVVGLAQGLEPFSGEEQTYHSELPEIFFFFLNRIVNC